MWLLNLGHSLTHSNLTNVTLVLVSRKHEQQHLLCKRWQRQLKAPWASAFFKNPTFQLYWWHFACGDVCYARPFLKHVCSIMRACQKAIRQVNVHTSWELANKSDRPHRQSGGLRGNIWIQQSRAHRGWRVGGGVGWSRASFCARLFKFQIPIRGSECHYSHTGVGPHQRGRLKYIDEV